MSQGKTPPRGSPTAGKRDALMDRIDGALARWPTREQAALEGDEMVDRARRGALATGAAAADVLRPPLPASAAERLGAIPGGWWSALGGISAVAAVAAGVFIGLPRAATNDTAGVGARPGATPAVQAEAPPAPPVAVDDRGVDLADLPRAASNDRRMTWPTAGRPGTAPKPTAPDPNAVADLPRGAPGSPASPDALQPAAAVAAGSGLAGGPDSVPLRPSTGAIQSALGVAGRAARACLAAGDPPSHATVTFRSDGSVSDVAVSGVATGTPAEGCIRGALSRARVPAFAEPSFAAPMTVRPN
ncbi:MAG: hypothetical protein ACLP1X_06550 [Polyangiaceae bacterium]